jgi:mono/diheme cytochrome c family protein
MSATLNSVLGMLFLLLAFATVFLMYHLWGYPFDKVKKKSEAPVGLMRLHRILGYAYGLIYIVLMTQMLPRLWNFQVEFPPRTVAHIMLGFTIGALLIIKLGILRFNRHLEEWMPMIGTALLICTVLLTGLSIPFAIRDNILSSQAVGGSAFSTENLARVRRLLPEAGFPEGTNLDNLATPATLRMGQRVLTTQCNLCHDLRTVLIRPRPPADWLSTVQRMAEKPHPTQILNLEAQHSVTTYLVAITPDLQRSAQEKRQQDTTPTTSSATGDGKALFEKNCSQCHESKLTESHAFKSEKDVRDLVARMVSNGWKADQSTLEAVIAHIKATYLK